MSEQNKKKPVKNIYKYEGKSIAKASRDCITFSQQIVSHMSRHYKYQIGSGFLNVVLQLAYSVYDALDWCGFNQEKVKKIDACLSTFRRVVIIVRILKDLNEITSMDFEKFIVMLNEIKLQLLNWKNFVIDKTEEENNNVSE